MSSISYLNSGDALLSKGKALPTASSPRESLSYQNWIGSGDNQGCVKTEQISPFALSAVCVGGPREHVHVRGA